MQLETTIGIYIRMDTRTEWTTTTVEVEGGTTAAILEAEILGVAISSVDMSW